LSNPSISEQSLDELASLTGTAEAQAAARLTAKCTVEIAKSLDQLSLTIHTSKVHLIEHLDGLVREMASTRAEMKEASSQASRQANALVTWTKVLAVVTAIYALLTGILVYVTARPH